MKLTPKEKADYEKLKKTLRGDQDEPVKELTLDEKIAEHTARNHQGWQNLGCGYGKRWNTFSNEISVKIPWQ